MKAEKLILMTDVPGVMRDKDDIATKFIELDIKDTRALVAEGVIAGGMIPKASPSSDIATTMSDEWYLRRRLASMFYVYSGRGLVLVRWNQRG